MAEHKALQGIAKSLERKLSSQKEREEILVLCKCVLDSDASVAASLFQVVFERINGGGIEAFVKGMCKILHITLPYTEAIQMWYEVIYPLLELPIPSALLKGDPIAEERAKRWYHPPAPDTDSWHQGR